MSDSEHEQIVLRHYKRCVFDAMTPSLLALLDPTEQRISDLAAGMHAVDNLWLDAVEKFGHVSVHATEGGVCVHVFKDHELGCSSDTLVGGLLHVLAVHRPGETNYELSESHELAGVQEVDEL